MSLGIKSSAFLKVEHPFSWKFEVQIFFDVSSTSGYVEEQLVQELCPSFFDTSSASGYIGWKHVQEFGSLN